MKINIKHIFIGILSAFLIAGCGSKYYFEPSESEIDGSVSYDGKINSSIDSIVRDGATLKNNQFITKYGEIPDIYLKKGGIYLNDSDDFYLTQNGNSLILINKENKEELEIKLDGVPIGASMDGALIAIILETNTLIIYDLNLMQIVFKQDNAPSPANNTLIASPHFLTDIVVLPTLDGKLVVVDKKTMQLVRNIVVNGDKYFNNVIFLSAIGNRMVAATPKRIISVSPSVINTLDANIKDVLFFEDRIFIFTSEGEVILTDRDLNEIRRKKFPFAHFSAANAGQNIAILETQGYMITLDTDLENSSIKRISSEITQHTFSTIDKIFVGDRFFNIK
ncbi:MAG: hypothetical protein SOW25_06525 [Helicobacter sp.]|nr:hypothetical protein [Helicobacter sp.]